MRLNGTEEYCRRIEEATRRGESILDEAKSVIIDRSAKYDERERNFSRIAAIWSVLLDTRITAPQVALCMIGLKLARECYKPGRDNLVDICGYADCLEDLINAEPCEEDEERCNR